MRQHKGFAHGLAPGTTQDMNCPFCVAEDAAKRQALRVPTHVVVDTRDGYVFRNGSTGELFGLSQAQAFARERNAELKFEYASSYQVFVLVPVPLDFKPQAVPVLDADADANMASPGDFANDVAGIETTS